jgi:hypothetical protein
VKWNNTIDDYLKDGDGVALPCTAVCNGTNCVSGCPRDADYQGKAVFGQLLGFDAPSSYDEMGAIIDMCFINLHVKHIDLPPEVVCDTLMML